LTGVSVEQWRVSRLTLPEPLVNGKVIVIDDYVYLIGSESNKVYRGYVNSKGEIEYWELDSKLPILVNYPTLYIREDTLYVIGGSNSNRILSNKIINGRLGVWNIEKILLRNESDKIVVTNTGIWSFDSTDYISRNVFENNVYFYGFNEEI
jgi:hypothetical protein